MQKDFFLFTIATLALTFITSCSVSDSEDDEYSKWTFSGTVIDSENGQSLDNVQISYQTSNGKIKNVESDSSGNFCINDLPYGSWNFTFNYTKVTKKDTLFYAPKIMNVGYSGESSRMEGVVASTALVVRLSPLSAKLFGEIYITEESTNKKIPASITKLYLVHQDTEFVNLEPKSFETESDSLGKFSFKDIPADTGLSLMVEAFSYKGLRYQASNIDLPRLRSGSNDIGRIYLAQDTTITKDSKIKESNVLDENLKGLENVSQLEIPYFIFDEKINSKNLSVTVTADTSNFFIVPEIKNDTLFLNHTEAFPPNAKISIKIIAYGKKSEDRFEVDLSEASAFTTSRGIYAVTSNAWPSNEEYKATFGIDDTIWVKFSKKIAKNTDRIQWSYTSDIDCTIYANGFYANSNSWIHKDTLFVQMQEDILKNRVQGDSVGMNITIYAEDGTYLDNFTLRTELIVPSSSSQINFYEDEEDDDD